MGHRRPFRVMSAITAAATCLVVAACSAAAPPPPEPELTVAVWGSSQDARTYQQRVDLARDHVGGLKIKLVHVPTTGTTARRSRR